MRDSTLLERRTIIARRFRISLFAVFFLATVCGCSSPSPVTDAGPTYTQSPERTVGPTYTQSSERTVGLLLNTPDSYSGYTVLAPSSSTETYLIDNDGNQVHSWPSNMATAGSARLLENGDLLRIGWPPTYLGFSLPILEGQRGDVEEIGWDGTLVWKYEFPSNWKQIHHDALKLPNGDVLVLVEEYMSGEEAIANGRDPSLLSDGYLVIDSIYQLRPTGPTSADIVWEWHISDHLVQDVDPTKANYGVVGEHPELIDFDYACPNVCGLGHMDWTHANAVDYNPQSDQVMISVRHFSEFWIIDHSTTTQEAAGHSGGRSGKGGDILYRWGNPAAYRAGGPEDQVFFEQHDAQWIKPGLPGAGDILVFNNGWMRAADGWTFSSIDQLTPPVDANGNYPQVATGEAYGPASETWTYVAPNTQDFSSIIISGAQRLPNGNTLICSGVAGDLFEVTSDGQTVWHYVNPVDTGGPVHQGERPAMSWVFRAYRYGPDYPGLQGKDLTPAGPIELYSPNSDADG